MSVDSNRPNEPDGFTVEELRDLWLSRLMFNMFVGWRPETRTFEQFCADHGVRL